MTDRDLLRQYLAEHSEGAFRALVARHSSLVYGVALRRLNGDSHMAQDAAQRTFLALVKKASHLQGRDNLAGWLHQAASLEASLLVRTEVRRRRREEESEAMHDPVEGDLSWDRLVPLIDESVAALSAKDRDPVLLRFFSGKSYAEIGALLGLNEDSARKRVERALEKLRELLKRRGVSSSAAVLGAILEGNAATPIAPGLQVSIANAAWAQAASVTASNLGLFLAAHKLLIAFAAAAVTLSAVCVTRDLVSNQDAALEAEQAAASASAAILRVHALQAQASALRAKAAAARAARPAPALSATLRARMSSPEYLQANLERALLDTHLRYRRLYAKLHLPQDRIDQFEKVMVAYRQGTLEVMLNQQNSPTTAPGLRENFLQFMADLRTALGDDGVKAYTEFTRSAPVFDFVYKVSTGLPASAPAMTEDQVSQVVNLALANDTHYRNGKPTDPTQVDWDAVWPPASHILDPSQLSVLKTMVESQTLDIEIDKRLRKISARATP